MRRLGVRTVGSVTVAAAMFCLAVGPVSLADAGLSVRDGYYAANVRLKSADLEFHVRGNGARTPDLALVCTPKDTSLLGSSDDAQIAVRAPVLKIRAGRIAYHGTAVVAPASAGERSTGTSTLSISLHRVSGPTIHFINTLGERSSETVAWKGTVSSPACTTIADDGKLTLVGPVAGE